MPLANQQYIKSELLPSLGAADRHIRSTAGTIISVLVQIDGVAGWPELLQALVSSLDSSDVNHVEGAMDALSKVPFSVIYRAFHLIVSTVQWTQCQPC